MFKMSSKPYSNQDPQEGYNKPVILQCCSQWFQKTRRRCKLLTQLGKTSNMLNNNPKC